MKEQFDEILNYLRGIWIKRRYILVSAWLICPLGWFGVSLIPDTYESTARVLVDTDSILGPLLKDMTVEADPEFKVNLMVKTLLSRNNLERIARMTDLDLQAGTPKQYELMIKDLTDDFYISKAKRDNIYTLSIVNKDPQLAKDIVEAALSVFIDNTLVDNRKDSNDALHFLDGQIRDYKQKLEKAESEISIFKQKYSSVLPSHAQGYYAHLNDERTRLSDSQLEYNVVMSELEKMKNMLYERPDSTVFSSSYDSRILTLQQSLDNLLLSYTEKHPSVIEVIRRISALRQLKKEEITKFESLSNIDKKAQFNLDTDNPILQEIQIAISELESKAFSLKVKANSYQKRVETLEGRINTIPGIEANLIALNRDYASNQAKYENLLASRESALLSSTVDETTDHVRFDVLDPPRVPVVPKGPKRLLLLLAVTIVGFGVGIGLSFLVSQLNPLAITSRQVSTSLGLPVYGEVNATESSNLPKWHRRKKWIFILSNAVLFACLLAIIGFYLKEDVINLLHRIY
jgi:polysaccharide chain length determinant protein (PEP-CTERM system associated)